MVINSGAAHWRRLATIMGSLHLASASSSGTLQAPAAVMHSGLRQGSTRASRPKQAETPDSIFLSSIMRTSFPWTITPHLGGIARRNGEMDIVGADGSVRPVR